MTKPVLIEKVDKDERWHKKTKDRGREWTDDFIPKPGGPDPI